MSRNSRCDISLPRQAHTVDFSVFLRIHSYSDIPPIPVVEMERRSWAISKAPDGGGGVDLMVADKGAAGAFGHETTSG